MPTDIRPQGYFPQGSFIIPTTAIERQRRLAQELAKTGGSGPVQSWTQGAARLAGALGSVLSEGRANQMEGQRQGALAKAMSGDISTPELERAAVASGDATLFDILKQRRADEMAKNAARAGLQPIWGKEGDKWVAYQPSNIPGQAPQRMDFGPNFQYQPPVQGYDTGTGTELRTRAGGLPPPGDGAPMPPVGTPHPLANPQAAPAAPSEVPPPVAAPSNVIPKDVAGRAEQAATGKAISDLKFSKPQLEQSLNNSELYMNNTIKSIDDIATSPGLEWSTGHIAGSPVGQIAGPYLSQDVANTHALLGTLKAQVTQAALQNMRDNSKTGGALGQVSNYEDKLLMDMIGALDPSQGTDQFKAQLQRIKEFTHSSMANRRNAYQQDLGLMGGGASSAGAAPPPANKSYTYDAQGNLVPQ